MRAPRRLLFALLLTAVAPILAAENLPSVAPKAVTVADAGLQALAPSEQVKRMGRGVNILGYDPLWSNADQARFKERHFRLIREGGFQTVRVNLHGLSHLDGQNRLEAAWLN